MTNIMAEKCKKCGAIPPPPPKKKEKVTKCSKCKSIYLYTADLFGNYSWIKIN